MNTEIFPLTIIRHSRNYSVKYRKYGDDSIFYDVMMRLILPFLLLQTFLFLLSLVVRYESKDIIELEQVRCNNYQFTLQLIDLLRQRHRKLNEFKYSLTASDSVIEWKNTIYIFFQFEHNLVYGPWFSKLPKSNVSIISPPYGHDYYRLRIQNLEKYMISDLIIEYSQPNFYHMKSSHLLPPVIEEKVVYVPSLQYTYIVEENDNRDNSNPNRPLNIISTCSKIVGRRQQAFKMLEGKGIKVTNFRNLSQAEDLMRVFSTAKIVLNIHQTDYHHTAEEFRLLPALLCGAVVVSEDVPLRETIPYQRYIIWTNLTSFPNTLKDITNNYQAYYDRIHGLQSELKRIFREMKEDSLKSLERRLLRVMEEKARQPAAVKVNIPASYFDYEKGPVTAAATMDTRPSVSRRKKASQGKP